MRNYDPLPTPADCSCISVQAALRQIGEQATRVSSDVYVSTAWTHADVKSFCDFLVRENCFANRVRKDADLRPFEWYVECCGTCVGSNPPG